MSLFLLPTCLKIHCNNLWWFRQWSNDPGWESFTVSKFESQTKDKGSKAEVKENTYKDFERIFGKRGAATYVWRFALLSQ